MSRKNRPKFPSPHLDSGKSILVKSVNYNKMVPSEIKPKFSDSLESKTASYNTLLSEPNKIILFKEEFVKKANLIPLFEKLALEMNIASSSSSKSSSSSNMSSNFGKGLGISNYNNYNQKTKTMQPKGTKYNSAGTNDTSIKQNIRKA